MIVVKRDGTIQPYDFEKVKNAVRKAFNSVNTNGAEEHDVPAKFFEQLKECYRI